MIHLARCCSSSSSIIHLRPPPSLLIFKRLSLTIFARALWAYLSILSFSFHLSKHAFQVLLFNITLQRRPQGKSYQGAVQSTPFFLYEQYKCIIRILNDKVALWTVSSHVFQFLSALYIFYHFGMPQFFQKLPKTMEWFHFCRAMWKRNFCK